MSLRIWLPLTKDLRQQGLSNVTITNNGATYSSTGGKLGGCYIFDGVDDAITVGNLSTLVTDNFSFACWFYHDDTWSSKNYETIFGGPSGFELETKSGSTNSPVIRAYSWGQGTFTYELNKWNHLVMTRTTSETKFYLNGELKLTGTAGTIPSGNYFVGSWSSTTGQNFKGKVNDVRIYDHCLSLMEVKELAKGLVLHYPLNRQGFGATNLLKNGFGELNQENWSNSHIYTDVPSGHSEIYKSYRDNGSVEFIPLFRNCTYKFTSWVKAASTSGYSYPSLKPYDADKLFISTHHCREGFNLSTMTTLKQQLKPGDTKIYVNDLSAWNANSGHHYNCAAIFSYTDGKGYTWPDGIYTRNCPAFASSTEAKTNLDKTNNIITLLSAYTGPTMPIGTKLCDSTYGSIYFYPFGGISNSSITDWTYKEGTFSSQNVRLECAKYLRVYAYSTCYQAGMTLSNITAEDLTATIEYDCSGFCNNLNKNGTYSYTSDTPKYAVSTNFNGTEWMSGATPGAEILTLACWAKTSKNKSTSQFMVADSTSNMCISFYNGYLIGLFASTNGTGGRSALDSNYKENEWNHFVVVKSGDNGQRTIYCNGVQLTSVSNDYWGSTTGFFIGSRNNSAALPFYGQICDVRAYATALSADDVKSLYQNSAYIDSSGNVYGAVHTEV